MDAGLIGLASIIDPFVVEYGLDDYYVFRVRITIPQKLAEHKNEEIL